MENINSGYGMSFIQNAVNGGVAGKVFFVSSVTTGAIIDRIKQMIKPDTSGTTRFFTTIDAAIGACTANRGDMIIVLPGHTETVTAAAGIDCDVAGITIVGIGSGSLKPTVTFTTATTADMDIDAANITIKNIKFDLTGVDALAAPIDVNAAYFTMQDCLVITASASAQATLAILTDANANGLTLINNQFLGTTDAGTAAAVRIVGGNEHQIIGNRFYGAYTASLGAIDNTTTACLRILVKDNIIENATASSTKAMVFVSTSTGTICENKMQILSGTAPITGAAMSWVGQNYYAATIATAGTLI